MTFEVIMGRDTVAAEHSALRFHDASTWAVDDDGYLYVIANGQTQGAFPPGVWMCIRKA